MKFISHTLLSIVLGLVIVLPAHGANLGDAIPNLENVSSRAGTTEGSLETVVGQIINGALTLVGLIFMILMVYAGYLWLTAQGEEDPINKAKKIITGSIIGLIVVLSAYAITFLVTSRLGAGVPETPQEPRSGAGCCLYENNPPLWVETEMACSAHCGGQAVDENVCQFLQDYSEAECY